MPAAPTPLPVSSHAPAARPPPAPQVLPYAQLTQQLGFPSVRELEDFIITDCMSEARPPFAVAPRSRRQRTQTRPARARDLRTSDPAASLFPQGIVKGKLDQERQQLDVHSSLGRDVRAAQLGDMAAALGAWLGTCEQLLGGIEDRVRWAQQAAEADARRAAEVAKRQDDARAAVKADLDLRTAGDPGAPSGARRAAFPDPSVGLVCLLHGWRAFPACQSAAPQC